MSRILMMGIVTIAIVLASVAALTRVPAVQDAVAQRVIDRMAGSQRDDLFVDDAMRVLVCGSGAPLPHPTRAKACVAVIAGGRFFVVDTGPMSWNNFASWRVPGDRIGGVLLTHFHSDHIGDLGEFNMNTWVAGRSTPLRVFGPTGVGRVVSGFSEAYALDTGYRIAHHGDEVLPSDGRARMNAQEFAIDGVEPRVILDEQRLRISAFVVDHDPIDPAVGYRFDYRGRSVVVSGDTIVSQTLVDAAQGVDVLVHEALATHMIEVVAETLGRNERPRLSKIMTDVLDYHTSPVEAAEVANAADAKLLVLYHLVPPPPNGLAADVFMRGVSDVRPEGVVMADDGTLIELPLDSEAVRVTEI